MWIIFYHSRNKGGTWEALARPFPVNWFFNIIPPRSPKNLLVYYLYYKFISYIIYYIVIQCFFFLIFSPPLIKNWATPMFLKLVFKINNNTKTLTLSVRNFQIFNPMKIISKICFGTSNLNTYKEYNIDTSYEKNYV